MSRTEQLISEYLDGRLDPAGAEELSRILAQDSAARQEFVELYRQHQILSSASAASTETMFVQSVLADLRARRRNPDSDQQIARISWLRKLWQQFTGFCRPSPAGWLALAGAAVLLMVAGWFLAFPSRPLSAMVIHSGPGTTVIRGGRSLACYDGFRLQNGDGLQTVAGETAVVQYLDEQTTLHLKENAKLFFRYAKQGKRLNLTAGEISVVAGHQPTNAPMIFITPKA